MDPRIITKCRNPGREHVKKRSGQDPSEKAKGSCGPPCATKFNGQPRKQGCLPQVNLSCPIEIDSGGIRRLSNGALAWPRIDQRIGDIPGEIVGNVKVGVRHETKCIWRGPAVKSVKIRLKIPSGLPFLITPPEGANKPLQPISLRLLYIIVGDCLSYVQPQVVRDFGVDGHERLSGFSELLGEYGHDKSMLPSFLPRDSPKIGNVIEVIVTADDGLAVLPGQSCNPEVILRNRLALPTKLVPHL